MFMIRSFLPNAIDVIRSGEFPLQTNLILAELRSDHRISARRFIADLLPKGSIGAELGVFTGLFSVSLLRFASPKRMFFVDPWWKEFGPNYPDWGVYTNHGRLETRAAHAIASKRIAKACKSNPNVSAEIIVQRSTEFLSDVPPGVLDWVYLDSTHSYEGTISELALLVEKLEQGKIVAGDDWQDDPQHPHSGVRRAVIEYVRQGFFELLGKFPAFQWAARRV